MVQPPPAETTVAGPVGAAIGRGQPNGVAPLDGDARVPEENLPPLVLPDEVTFTAVTIHGDDPAAVPAEVRGAMGQTANLHEWRSPDGTAVLVAVTAEGAVYVLSGLTTDGDVAAAGDLSGTDLHLTGTAYADGDELETTTGAQAKVATETTRAEGVEATKADLVGGKIPTSQLPTLALTTAVPVLNQAAMLALTSAQVQPGDLALRGDGAGTFMLMATDPSVLGNWLLLPSPTDAVLSVNGQTGTIVLAAADVGAVTAAQVTTAINAAAVLLSTVDAKGDLLVGTADNTVARLGVGADGRRIVADSTQTAGMRWADLTAQVTQWTVPQTGTAYTIPDGAVRLKLRVQGAGAGGGSGRRGAAGSVRTGGSGGVAGGYSEWEVAAADVGGAGATLLIKVGAGTAGGAAQTADSTDGATASNAGNSYVRTAAGMDLCAADGGRGGRAGSTGAASASAGVLGKFISAASGSSNGSGGTGSVGGDSAAGGSGGGGGGVTVANAGSTGGDGGRATGVTSSGAANGGTTGNPGGNGSNPSSGLLAAGSAGAGGGGNPAGAGGNGGDGGRGAGGGGGGASVNGSASGAGGAGGDGFVEIVAYF